MPLPLNNDPTPDPDRREERAEEPAGGLPSRESLLAHTRQQAIDELVPPFMERCSAQGSIFEPTIEDLGGVSHIRELIPRLVASNYSRDSLSVVELATCQLRAWDSSAAVVLLTEVCAWRSGHALLPTSLEEPDPAEGGHGPFWTMASVESFEAPAGVIARDNPIAKVISCEALLSPRAQEEARVHAIGVSRHLELTFRRAPGNVVRDLGAGSLILAMVLSRVQASHQSGDQDLRLEGPSADEILRVRDSGKAPPILGLSRLRIVKGVSGHEVGVVAFNLSEVSGRNADRLVLGHDAFHQKIYRLDLHPRTGSLPEPVIESVQVAPFRLAI